MRSTLMVAMAMAGIPGTAGAQAAGEAAAQLLRLPPAPAVAALGGAYTAGAGELALFYNPARLATAPGAGTIAFLPLPLDARAGAAAVGVAFGPGALGAGVQFLHFGEVEVLEPEAGSGGVPAGRMATAGEVAIGVGYGIAWGPVEWGLGAKVLRLGVDDLAATAIGVDAGTAVTLLRGRLTLAAAALNLGRDVTLGTESPLPSTYRAGAALRGGSEETGATLHVDAIALGSSHGMATGVEARWMPGGARVSLRGGWQGGEVAEAGPVIGAGIGFGAVTFDYSFRSSVIGDGHHFGLRWRYR
jgi:hypothetical protein